MLSISVRSRFAACLKDGSLSSLPRASATASAVISFGCMASAAPVGSSAEVLEG
jgi:hypothetical protein